MAIKPEKMEEVLTLIKEGKSYRNIEELTGIPRTTVLYACRRAGFVSSHALSEIGKIFNHDFFEIIDSEEKAYWLGYLFADGSIISQRASKSINLSIKEDDLKHIEKYKKSLCYNKEPSKKLVKLQDKVFGAYRITLTSSKMYNDLLDKGITERKSLTLKPPKNVPKQLIRHFIRGYFDGDGSVFLPSRDKRLVFSILGTPEFLGFIKKETKVDASIRLKKKGSNIFRFSSSTSFKVFQLYNYLYKDATIFMERKKEKFDNFYKGL